MCGIAGFIGEFPEEQSMLYNILKGLVSVGQDPRGGDNAGFLELTKDTLGDYYHRIHWGDPDKKEKKLIDIVSKMSSVELEDKIYTPTNEMFISHSRSSSSGFGDNYDNAHPFVIEGEESSLIGVHNGTLRGDWEKLMSKYTDVSTIECDSEALLKCIHKSGYEILNEYEGAATLLWTTTDEKALYAFTGRSYYSTRYAGTPTDQIERPLHIVKCKYGYFFTSLPGVFDLISRMVNDFEIFHLEPNKVLKFTQEGIEEVYSVTRPLKEDVIKKKTLPKKVNKNVNSFNDVTYSFTNEIPTIPSSNGHKIDSLRSFDNMFPHSRLNDIYFQGVANENIYCIRKSFGVTYYVYVPKNELYYVDRDCILSNFKAVLDVESNQYVLGQVFIDNKTILKLYKYPNTPKNILYTESISNRVDEEEVYYMFGYQISSEEFKHIFFMFMNLPFTLECDVESACINELRKLRTKLIV